VVGAIALARSETGGFDDTRVALVQSFAEQAVIAISRAETYRALQTRTSDLEETLEYQTATNDVLNVISRSTFDLEPVFRLHRRPFVQCRSGWHLPPPER
jgi:two-component system NtrC family sensor kinase